MNDSRDHYNESGILESVKNLDARISRIEEHLGLEPLSDGGVESRQSETPVQVHQGGEDLEFRIGQAWFAKVGIVVLAVGIAFLLTFPYQNLPAVAPSLFGYLLVGGILVLSRYWRQTFVLVSRYLIGGALVLLFFTTLRLHFFASPPALADLTVELVLLLVVVAFNLIVSIRRQSIYLTGLSLTMGYITAVVGGESGFVFGVVTIMSCLTAYFVLKMSWQPLIVLGILLSYGCHCIWSINNPILGNALSWMHSPHINLYFILLYAFIFSLADLLQKKDRSENFLLLITSALNGFGCYVLYTVLTLAAFKTNLFWDHTLASLLFLTLSVAFWVRNESRYATFVYAMLGYLALTVAIVAQTNIPETFIWLSFESVLVVSTAVWYRSRLIIVANFVIYVVMFIAYLFVAGSSSVVGLSFGAVALLAARILNWQKDRLELRTEKMRNAYLASAFFIFPYALYHVVPSGYVSLSWIGVSMFYYAASLFLKSTKYRWMSLLTLIMTVLHVFIVDSRNLEATYRIASFLVLGIVLVMISLVYSRSRTKVRSAEVEKAAEKVKNPDS